MNIQEKNLIIGMAYGYDFDKIRNFVDSLVRVKYIDKLVIVADNNMVVPDKYAKLIDLEIIYDHRFSKNIFDRAINKILSSKFMRSYVKNILLFLLEKDNKIFFGFFIYVYHVVSSRFAFYYEYLRKNKYDKIFITDVRDVYFQNNVFDTSIDAIHVFNEQELFTIKQCPWNSTWIQNEFGMSMLDKIGDERIFCAGTILLEYNSCLKFLKEFLFTILNSNGSMNVYGPDMAVFNNIIYRNSLGNIIKHRNGDVVLTVTHETFPYIQIHSNGLIKYNDYAPDVIHQYDRHDALNEYINKLNAVNS